MLPQIPIPRYTIHDYNLWEGAWELIQGYPYAMSPSPLPKHQLLSSKIVAFLMQTLSANKPVACDCKVLYESDWVISEDTIIRPDIMIVCGPFDENDFIRIPPALAVEIFSNSTRLKDRNIKFTIYQQYGVKYYLMADPDKKTLEAFELVNNQYAQMQEPFRFSLHKNCAVSLTEEQIFAV